MLAEMGSKRGETDNAIMSHDATLTAPKLEDVGITRKQSSRWQSIVTGGNPSDRVSSGWLGTVSFNNPQGI